MSKDSNIYSEEIKLNAYYTYDKNHNKVYDIKGIRKDFKKFKKVFIKTWSIRANYCKKTR